MTNSAVSAAKTNVLAIVSLVTSLFGLSLVGIITGHIALSQIKKTGEEGRRPAFAGLAIGYVSIFIVLMWLFVGNGLYILFVGQLGVVGRSVLY